MKEKFIKPTPLIGGMLFSSLLILLFYIYFTNQIKLEKIILLISIYSFFLVGFLMMLRHFLQN